MAVFVEENHFPTIDEIGPPEQPYDDRSEEDDVESESEASETQQLTEPTGGSLFMDCWV